MSSEAPAADAGKPPEQPDASTSEPAASGASDRVKDSAAAKDAKMEWDGARWLWRDPASGTAFAFDDAAQQWQEYRVTQDVNTAEIGGVWVYREPASGVVSVYDAAQQKWTPVEEPKEEEEEAAKDDDEDKEDPELAFQLAAEKAERGRIAERRKAAKAKGGAVFLSPKDGTVWEWSPAAGWAPDLDDDFLARYQASYGNYQPPAEEEKTEEEESKEELTEEEKAAKKRKKDPEWFEQAEEESLNVYVQGLPKDKFTQEAFAELMAKCGVLAIDPRTRRPKAKLYKEDSGELKGDGLATYFKRESVELALKILDGSRLPNGNTLKVSVAKFKLKGDFDPTLAKKNKLTKAQKKLQQEQQAKMLDWKPEAIRGVRPKTDAVIVLKGLFDPAEFTLKPELLIETEELLKAECSRYGELVKATVFGTNPDGVAMLKYASPQVGPHFGDCRRKSC